MNIAEQIANDAAWRLKTGQPQVYGGLFTSLVLNLIVRAIVAMILGELGFKVRVGLLGMPKVVGHVPSDKRKLATDLATEAVPEVLDVVSMKVTGVTFRAWIASTDGGDA